MTEESSSGASSDIKPALSSSAAAEVGRPGSHPQTPPAEPLAGVHLRLLPAVVILVLQELLTRLPGWIAPGTFIQFIAMRWGPILGTAALCVWWLFFSRVPWRNRFALLAVLAVEAALARWLNHRSMRMLFIAAIVPAVSVALVLAALCTARLAWRRRCVVVALAPIPVWLYFGLLRLDGLDGSLNRISSWRWSATPESLFLSSRTPASETPAAVAPLELRAGDWPEFRGPQRDSRVIPLPFDTDWERHPPRLIWRRRVGPGWSSFALVDGHLFTQEQRGENEAVVCLRLETGAEVWSHEDPTRFSEAMGGVGPRATPTFDAGYLYSLGASGRLNCLAARTGRVIWSRDLAADSGAKVPVWGFSSSPLIVDGIVVVFAGGPAGKSVLGYRAQDGELAWSAGKGRVSYSSPHKLSVDGDVQILMASDYGLIALEPARGGLLWEHEWQMPGDAPRVVQPHLLKDGSILLGTGYGHGTRQLQLRHSGKTWEAEAGWTTKGLKPYFNDFVSQDGFLYGFDAEIFCCIDAQTGKRRWKGGRYGHGQVLLLEGQKTLLILSETGVVVLVQATPERHVEVAQFDALSGKTWNHPVVARGKLCVRNAEEAACYELAAPPRQPASSRVPLTEAPAP
jgi:outer membrane protein assembly factor BamB